ncbi:low specificity L-threonine aldolase [Cohnella sp. WQ 127256]|uniref:threonine aldolase family protein n=1 Tax=Cohnella sp. WQ 127256 TaxID=2938790 RepID=UPI002117E75A|nr:beta-eliminating lyase-related protein [Cohnella sp. WQ 127256]
MSDKKSLLEAYKEASFPVDGHGKRNIEVLQAAFKEIEGDVDSDIYGKGATIEDFQGRMAEFLGKESAVFFPSGTMAQQIALRIWCDQKGLKKIAYHPLSHLELHEEDALKQLHHIEPILIADKTRVIRLDDVMNLQEDIACLLLELPQREIGGQLPKYEELVAISAYCRERGIKLHLDGARLFEITPYYQKSVAEISQLFDSVYVSFYKGIGGIAGAILAGDAEFTKESKVWKRRHGGDLISLYPYILSSDYYFKQRIDKMEQYYIQAKELASFYNQCSGVATTPVEPVSNMFHVHVEAPKELLESILISIYETTGIGLTRYLRETNETSCNFEVSIGDLYANLPKERVKEAFKLLNERLESTVS